MTPATHTPRPADQRLIEFYTTEDGDPWALFCWGDVPASTFTIDACVKAVIEYGRWNQTDAQELIGLGIDPQPLWIRHAVGEGADYAYRFCREDHPDAQRITGTRF